MTKSMNARALRNEPGTIWHNSGDPDRCPAPPVPAPLAAVRAAEPLARPPVATLPPPSMRLRDHVARLFDGVIAASSLASTEPVLDVRDFAWTATLRRDWRAIREEALALTGADGPLPAACGTIALWRDGHALDEGCPRTLAALASIPGLHDAAFARLAPGAHVLPRRGMTKALVTCHLGLVVPRDGSARMRVRDRIVRWSEGQTLVFDDTYCHEAWNDAQAARVILHLRFARPLRQPGRMIADSVLRLLGTQG